MPTEPDRQRLREAVAARRKQLQLSVSAAAQAAGINRATWSALEAGTRATEEYVYGGVERALDWAPGSVEAILQGGAPTERTPEPADVGARLAEIRDDADMPTYLRRQAQAALDNIAALTEAAEAERQHRRRAG